MWLRSAMLAVAAAVLSGCIALPEHNAIVAEARPRVGADIERMRGDPRPLLRPLVVLNGYRAPGVFGEEIGARLRGMTSGRAGDVLVVSYPWSDDVDAMAAAVIARVRERWPGGSEEETVEVDVVGLSIGGVVARWAALPAAERVREGEALAGDSARGPRLRIARLFTISARHRGARAADWMGLTRAERDVRAGSGLLRTLDARFGGRGYEIVCYAQAGDSIVGVMRSAPEGITPIWSS